MKRLISVVGMLGLALSLVASQASANIVYTFSGVTFDDGGTLTGTFETNDTFNSLVDFDITTSPGVAIGFNYTPATATSGSTSLPFILVLNSSLLTADLLQVTFTNLTAAGAPITIGTNDSFEQGSSAADPTRRDIVSGEVVVATTAVPEPSTIALASIGLLGLLGFARLRRRT
jgi:hypothetical protein